MKALKDLNFPFGGWRCCFIIIAVLAVALLVGIPRSHQDAAADQPSTIKKGTSGEEDPMAELQRLVDESKAKPAWRQYLEAHWIFGLGIVTGIGLLALLFLILRDARRRREPQVSDSQEEVTQMDIQKIAPYVGIGILVVALILGYAIPYRTAVGERDKAVAKVDSLSTVVDQKNETIQGLNTQVSEKNKAIQGLNEAIDGEGGYKAQITGKDEQITSLTEQLTAAQAQLAARTKGGKKGGAPAATGGGGGPWSKFKRR